PSALNLEDRGSRLTESTLRTRLPSPPAASNFVKRTDTMRMYHRVPKVFLAALTGTIALATVSGIGLTTATDASATGACTDTITGSHSGTMTLSGPGTTRLKNATQDGAITAMTGHE